MRIAPHVQRLDAHSDVVHDGRIVRIVHFHIEPRDPEWAALNPVDDGPWVAFPLRPVRIHHAGLEAFVADSNTAILFDTTRPYRRSLVDEAGAAAISFRFAPALVRDAVRGFDPAVDDGASLFRFGHGPVASPAYLRQRQLFAHVAQHAGADPLLVQENALAVLEDVVAASFAARGVRARAADPRTDRAHRHLAEQIKELLATCYSKRLTLDDVSDALGGTSPFHLCRLFRGHTGKPVHRYLTDLRLRAALERLDDGVAVGRVAADVGFGTHSHFAAVFRRELGATPTDVRTRLRIGEFPILSRRT